MNTLNRPDLSPRLCVGPAGLLRHKVTTGTYHQVIGTHTYASQEPSNEPILFTSADEALPTATSLSLSQRRAAAERGFNWLLGGMAALLALAAGLH